MTRDDQIRKANPHILHDVRNSEEGMLFNDGQHHGFTEGAHWADEHPADRWISVEDRLPEEQVEVVFYANRYEWWTGMYTPPGLFDSDPIGGFAYHAHWGDDEYHKVESVKAYMILPTSEAPK